MDKSLILDILRKTESAHTRLLAALGDALGIGSSGSQALIHLADAKGLTPSELAQRVRLTLPAVTALVDRLEAKGYARRDPHPTDRRSLMICLTDIGRVRVARIFKQLVSKIESLEAGLSASERDVIELFLTQLRDILEEEATTIHLDPPQVTDKFNAK